MRIPLPDVPHSHHVLFLVSTWRPVRLSDTGLIVALAVTVVGVVLVLGTPVPLPLSHVRHPLLGLPIDVPGPLAVIRGTFLL